MKLPDYSSSTSGGTTNRKSWPAASKRHWLRPTPGNEMEMRERQPGKAETVPLHTVGLWELVRYFLRLGAFGFGGPIALAGYMQRDLIPRAWITEQEYLEGLAFSQMM